MEKSENHSIKPYLEEVVNSLKTFQTFQVKIK